MKIKCIGAMVIECKQGLDIRFFNDIVDKEQALESRKQSLASHLKYIAGIVTDDIDRQDWIVNQANKLLQQETKQKIRIAEVQVKGWIKNDSIKR